MTPLHYAVDRCSIEAIRFLLENGADIDAADEDGQTALDIAETCEHEVQFKIYLEYFTLTCYILLQDAIQILRNYRNSKVGST
jgi:ankyrin repeat protein